MPTPDDFKAMREVEEQWLADELGRAIKALGYPVGMGMAPSDAHLRSAARVLFDRYVRMIEMAHETAQSIG